MATIDVVKSSMLDAILDTFTENKVKLMGDYLDRSCRLVIPYSRNMAQVAMVFSLNL